MQSYLLSNKKKSTKVKKLFERDFSPKSNKLTNAGNSPLSCCPTIRDSYFRGRRYDLGMSILMTNNSPAICMGQHPSGLCRERIKTDWSYRFYCHPKFVDLLFYEWIQSCRSTKSDKCLLSFVLHLHVVSFSANGDSDVQSNLIDDTEAFHDIHEFMSSVLYILIANSINIDLINKLNVDFN